MRIAKPVAVAVAAAAAASLAGTAPLRANEHYRKLTDVQLKMDDGHSPLEKRAPST